MDGVVEYIEMFADALAKLFSYLKDFLAKLGIDLGDTATATDGE